MKTKLDVKQIAMTAGGIVVTIGCLTYALMPFISDRMHVSAQAKAVKAWSEQAQAAGPGAALNPNAVPVPAGTPVVAAAAVPEPVGPAPAAPEVVAADTAKTEKPGPETGPLREETPNPFLTREEREALKKQGTLPVLDYLTVSAIMYSPGGRRAVIDGRIVEEGDSIDGKEIVRIEAEQVVCRDAFREYIIAISKVVSVPQEARVDDPSAKN